MARSPADRSRVPSPAWSLSPCTAESTPRLGGGHRFDRRTAQRLRPTRRPGSAPHWSRSWVWADWGDDSTLQMAVRTPRGRVVNGQVEVRAGGHHGDFHMATDTPASQVRCATTAPARLIPAGQPWRNGYSNRSTAVSSATMPQHQHFCSLAQPRVVITDWKDDHNHRRGRQPGGRGHRCTGHHRPARPEAGGSPPHCPCAACPAPARATNCSPGPGSITPPSQTSQERLSETDCQAKLTRLCRRRAPATRFTAPRTNIPMPA